MNTNFPRKKVNRSLRKNAYPGKHSITKADKGPGEHGSEKRGGGSDYKVQLQSKQFLRHSYCMKEGQFKSWFKDAQKRRGNTGMNFVSDLESRLGSVVCRMNFAPTVIAARKAIVHGHFTVNGKKVDVPGYSLQPGDRVELREKSRNIAVFVDCAKAQKNKLPDYMEFDSDKLVGVFLRFPETLEEVPYSAPVNFDKITEFYSR